jgi:hypothetical protein
LPRLSDRSGDADQALLEDDLLLAGHLAVVDHDHDLRLVRLRRRVAGEPLPVAQLLVEPVLHLGQRTGHHPHLTDAVDHRRVLAVGQPLRPLPLGLRAAARHHGDQHVVGRVEGHELGEQRAGEAAGQLLVTGEADGGEAADGDLDRQLGDDRVRAHEPPQRQRGDRLQLVDRAGLRRHEPGREALGAAARAQVAEVGVGLAALPHAAAGRHGPQRLRVGVHPLQRGALVERGLTGPVTHLAEVAQVVLAVLVHLGLLLAAAPVLAEHADHREHHHHREQQRHRVAAEGAARGEHQGHHAQHRDDHHDGHELHQDVAGDDAGHLGRRLEVDLAAGLPRRGQPR